MADLFDPLLLGADLVFVGEHEGIVMYTDGNTRSVANVYITSPPITARPSGACIWLPRSRANAIGTIPTVIAQAVIRIGRKRCRPPPPPPPQTTNSPLSNSRSKR